MTQTPRIGLVGLGKWGRTLARNLGELGALSCAADVAPSARTGLDVPVWDSPNAVLDAEVDAVVIATPAPTHAAIAAAALQAGKDVFVEKPMALTSIDAAALAADAHVSERVLMVGHLLLYQPAILWIADAIARGVVGQPLATVHERLQFGTARAAENALWSLGVHDIAVALFLAGRAPDRITARGRTVGAASEPAEDVSAELGFGDGPVATIHASWRWPERRRQLTVLGTEAMLVYDELAQEVWLHRKCFVADRPGQPRLVRADDGVECVLKGHREPLRLELDAFLSCIRTRVRPRADAASGVEVVRVLEAADRQLSASF